MPNPIIFVNITHPSQLRGDYFRRKVKVYTSRYNKRRNFVPAEADTSYHSPPSSGEDRELQIPSPRSNDGNKLEETQTENPRRHGFEDGYIPNYPEIVGQESEDKDIAREEIEDKDRDFEEEAEVEEVVCDDFNDVFPDVGNLLVPYLETSYSSKSARARLPRLFEYYLRVFGPNDMWRPTLTTRIGLVQFKRDFFALSMQQPVVLEALFALCQTRLDLKVAPDAPQSLAVLQHRGRVLRMVQESLSVSPNSVHDAVLFGIIGMMTADVLFANWASFRANLNGTRRIIAMKGSMDNLGWHGWFKGFFIWAELRWTGHIARLAATRPEDIQSATPVYATHPFPPGLCRTVSNLPRGLASTALSRQLSKEVINLLAQVSEWRQRYSSRSLNTQLITARYQESMHLTIRLASILGSFRLKQTEQLICIGVLAFIVSSDGRFPQIERMPRGLEDHMIGMERLSSGLDVADSRSHLWVAVMIATSSDSTVSPLLNRWMLLDEVVGVEAYTLWNWEKVVAVLQNYFWDDSLNARAEACWRTALERRYRRRMDEDFDRGMALVSRSLQSVAA